jgi:hexosaminidase
MAVTVDLGEVKSLRSLHAQLYLYQDAWIFLPEQVLWSTSMDGVTFDLVGQSLDDMASLEPDPRQKTVAIDLQLEGRKARYVSMELVNPGVCPSWHDAATEPTWMFVDELVVLGDLEGLD